MSARQKTIMLVDDDTDFLEMNARLLEAGGYRVVCCAMSHEAVNKMAEEKPHLVITDLMMKALDSGFSFSRRIKQDAHFSDIPVIVISSIGSHRGFDFRPRTADELAAMHADAYFDKPIEPDTLLTKVRELLEDRVKEDPT